MGDVRTEVKNGCGIVTVDRPSVLNALSINTIEELKSAFRGLRNDDNVAAVILTGEGKRAFIAGADVKEMAPLGPEEAIEFSRKGQDLTLLIESFPKPVIAAVNGYALGGGCEVALACHIRIASENARFGQPEVNLGIIPGWGGTQRLPAVVGISKATEMITSGESITSQEAKKIGLVDHLVSPEQLLEKAIEIGQSIGKRGPVAVKLSLEAIRYGLGRSPEEGMEQESSLFGIAFSTPEKKEGIQAFIEKRKPQFRGGK